MAEDKTALPSSAGVAQQSPPHTSVGLLCSPSLSAAAPR